jgi:hypothetical protein
VPPLRTTESRISGGKKKKVLLSLCGFSLSLSLKTLWPLPPPPHPTPNNLKHKQTEQEKKKRKRTENIYKLFITVNNTLLRMIQNADEFIKKIK